MLRESCKVVSILFVCGAAALTAYAFPGPGDEFIVKEDLGTLPAHSRSTAAAINSSRQVTGQSGVGTAGNAFLWTPPGPMVALEPANKLFSGVAINDAGQIAGDATFLDFAFDTFLWTPPAGPGEFLEPPPGALFDEFAGGLNNQGDVVGAWEDPPLRPFLWRSPGPAVDLGTLGGSDGFASDINDAGAVVGATKLAGDAVSHGFYWTQGGGMLDLGPLPNTASVARAINNSDEIVGSVGSGTSERAAFWPSPGAELVNLGTLGGSFSRAYDINDSGVIVGESSIFSGPTRAFRRKAPAGPMTDLSTLGGADSRARGINNAGHIVGEAQLANGDIHATAWWVYKVDLGLECGCFSIPIPFPPVPGLGEVVVVAIPTTRQLDARQVDARTLTLGDSQGAEAPVAVDPGSGELLAKFIGAGYQGDRLLVVLFEKAVLVQNGDLTSSTTQLWIQGALRDRSNGLFGVVKITDTGR